MRAIALRGGMWVVAVAVSLASCSALQSGPDDPVQLELDRQRRQWRAQGIASYSYTVRRACFCPPEFTDPVVVRVRDGRVESRSYADGGRAVDAERARSWPAVEGLFDVVQEAIDREADSISVRYHPELGYPTEVQIDYERMAADEELGLAAYGLESLR